LPIQYADTAFDSIGLYLASKGTIINDGTLTNEEVRDFLVSKGLDSTK
jgi:hypothetical protein